MHTKHYASVLFASVIIIVYKNEALCTDLAPVGNINGTINSNKGGYFFPGPYSDANSFFTHIHIYIYIVGRI